MVIITCGIEKGWMIFDEIIEAIGRKPYYRDKWCAIYHADCRDILPLIPDKSIDLVLTDPPYGINLDLTWLSELHLARSKPANRTDAPIFGDAEVDVSFLMNFGSWIIWGFPYIDTGKATGWLVWDKQPNIETDRTLTTPVEMASTNCWRGFRLVRCMWAGYLRDNGEYRYAHPTQKPQKIMDYCLNKTNANIILDPFLGSGTTCYCAKKLNRYSIGIEIEEKYCEIAAKRVSQSVFSFDIEPKSIANQQQSML